MDLLPLLVTVAATGEVPVNPNTLIGVVCTIAGTVATALILLIRYMMSQGKQSQEDFKEIGRQFASAVSANTVEAAENRNTFEQTIAGLMNEHREDRYAYRDSMKDIAKEIGGIHGKLDRIGSEIHRGVDVAKKVAEEKA